MSHIESIYRSVTDVKDSVIGTGSAQSGEEPPSGFQGQGTAGDPYDQGNIERYDQGNVRRPVESGEEPPSGIQGKGTATDPYNAGNAPENVERSVVSGEEPPSGIQGLGTATDPYDAGNAPENVEYPTESREEPPSGFQGKGTTSDPYDGGNAPEISSSSESRTAATFAQQTDPSVSVAAASRTPSDSKTTSNADADTRGREPLKTPPRAREETDVSPGTLPDGSHAQTSGDRGENYEPGKLSRLKGKLAFGRH